MKAKIKILTLIIAIVLFIIGFAYLFLFNNFLKKGEACGPNIGKCRIGLKCVYPCGIHGCAGYVCASVFEGDRP